MKIFDAILPRLPQKIEDLPSSLSLLIEILQRHLDSVTRAFNGRISFGDGTNTDNIFGTFIDVTFAGADVELEVTHNVNHIPGGFIVLWQDRAGSLYKGGTAWTSSKIYLKSSTASLQARIFVI